MTLRITSFLLISLILGVGSSAQAQVRRSQGTASRPDRTLTQVVKTRPASLQVGVALDEEFSFSLSRPIDPNTLNANSLHLSVDGVAIESIRRHSMDRRSVYVKAAGFLPGDANMQAQLDGGVLQDVDGRFIDADGDFYPGGVSLVEVATTAAVPIPVVTAPALVVGDVSRLEIDSVTMERSQLPLNGALVQLYLYPGTGVPAVASTLTNPDGSFMLTTPDVSGSQEFLLQISFLGHSEALRYIPAQANGCMRVDDAVLQQLAPPVFIDPMADETVMDPFTQTVSLEIPAGALGTVSPSIAVTVLESEEFLRSGLPRLTAGLGTFIDIAASSGSGEPLACADCAVTMTIPNQFGLDPFTPVPFGKVDHDTLEWIDLRSLYGGEGGAPADFLGEVSADGATISVSFDHFCTICTPFCNPVPNTNQDEFQNTSNNNDPSRQCGNSTIDTHEGILQEELSLPTFREFGREIGLSLVYDSSTARPSTSLGSRVAYDGVRPVERTSFTFRIEGWEKEITYGPSAGVDHNSRWLWDGTNILGDQLPTGIYSYTVDSVSLHAQSAADPLVISLPDYFGGAPTISTGVPYPGAVLSEAETVRGNAILVNQIESAYGAGWNLSVDERIYPTNSGALIVSGAERRFFPKRWTLQGEFADFSILDSCGLPPQGLPSSVLGTPPAISVWSSTCVWSYVFDGYESPRGESPRSTLVRDTANGGWIRTFPDGTVRAYSDLGRLETIEDRYGNVTTMTYDPQSRLTKVETPTGFFWDVLYDGNGKLSSIVDSALREARFVVDANGDLVSMENAVSVASGDGSLRTFEYDEHLLIRQQKPRGESSEYGSLNGRVIVARAYDTNGALLRTRDFSPVALAEDLQVALDSGVGDPANPADVNPARVSTYTDGRGYTTIYEQDDTGRTSRVIDPLGGVTEMEYSGRGLLSAVRNPRGTLLTTYSYDGGSNQLRKVTQAEIGPEGSPNPLPYATIDILYGGSQLSYGQPFRVVDPLGNKTEFFFDPVGNVVRASDALGQERNIEYDDSIFPNLPSRLISEDGSYVDLTYDVHGNLETRTDEVPRTLTLTNSADTGFLEEVQPHGELVPFITYVYDELNRIVEQFGGEQEHVQFDYGDTSCGCSTANLTQVTFANGTTMQYQYDGLDRNTAIVDQLGNATVNTFDDEGHLVQVENRNLEQTQYVYDVLGRMIASNVENGELTTYAYDADGNLVSAANSFCVLDFTHDFLGRTVAAGRSLFLDEFGEPVPQYHLVEYMYDENDRRTTMFDGPRGVGYGYDALDRLTAIVTESGQQFDFGYDARSRRTALARPNGVMTSYEFDDAGQLTRILDQGPSGLVQDLTYDAYDGFGRLTEESTSSPLLSFSRSYAYDDLSRLVGVTGSTGPAEALIDIEKGDVSFDDANRITTDPEFGYEHDSAGRMIAKIDGDWRTDYEYDARGQLRGLAETVGRPPSTSTELSASYRYDPMGRRVVRSVNDVTSVYEYDGLDLVRIRGGEGGVERFFVHGSRIDEPLRFDLGEVGSEHYYHTDRLGSVRALTDSSGVLQQAFAYEAFGAQSAAVGNGPPQPFGYAARAYDPESGLQYARARYYSSHVGRFQSGDPLGIAGGLHGYDYAQSNPINLKDPMGLSPTRLVRTVVTRSRKGHQRYSVVPPVGTAGYGPSGLVISAAIHILAVAAKKNPATILPVAVAELVLGLDSLWTATFGQRFGGSLYDWRNEDRLLREESHVELLTRIRYLNNQLDSLPSELRNDPSTTGGCSSGG